MVKLAVLISTLLVLLGSASSQSDVGVYPPIPSPASPNRITYPPSVSPGLSMYPPSVSPSPSLLAYVPSQSTPAYPPSTSRPIYAPSILIAPSPSSLPIRTKPAYHQVQVRPLMNPAQARARLLSRRAQAQKARSLLLILLLLAQDHPPQVPQQSYPPSPVPAPAVYSPVSDPPIDPPSPGLTVGHYMYSCPNAEEIVRQAVKDATDKNRGTGAGLIRLFFHDCFVRGCDASVLLNTTGSSTGEPTERQGAPNLTAAGFEAIDGAKAALELACPGVVSCADTLAFAARDATFFLGTDGIRRDFAMPAGRRDGRVSLAAETVPNLPSPSSGLDQLVARFAAKGLGVADMVALSGAHSVGRARCSSFSARLVNSTPNASEPVSAMDMDTELARSLRAQCDGSGGESSMVAMQDFRTPDVLDARYYENVLRREVLFGSDAALVASEGTAGMVLENARVSGLWESRFAAAMVRMGAVGARTAGDDDDGEIRKKCWINN